MIEASTCDGCGQPITESHDPDRSGWYEVHELTCAGCYAKETHQRDNKDPEPGVKLQVVPDPNYVRRS